MRNVAKILISLGVWLLVGYASLEVSAEPVSPSTASQIVWQEIGPRPGRWLISYPGHIFIATMMNDGLMFSLSYTCPNGEETVIVWVAGAKVATTDKDCPGQTIFVDVSSHNHPVFVASMPMLAKWHYDLTVAAYWKR